MVIDNKEIESNFMIRLRKLSEKLDCIAHKIVEWQFKGCNFLVGEYDFREEKFLYGNEFGRCFADALRLEHNVIFNIKLYKVGSYLGSILQISLQMEDEILLSPQDQPDFLLDYSRISHNHQDNNLRQFSISRDKMSITERERTRQDSYQDILKEIQEAKLDRTQLMKEIESLKCEIFTKYLGNFRQELQDLNEQNIRLRKEIQNSTQKKDEDLGQKYSTRSPMRLRVSVKSNYGIQNKKTNTKSQRNRVSPNIVLVRKQIKMTESTSNLRRSHIRSPQNHKKRESQLTQRKIQDNKVIKTQMSFSILDERGEDCNMRQSLSSRNFNQRSSNKNVFVRILENILQQQRQYEQEKYRQIQTCAFTLPNQHFSEQVHCVNQMQGQINETHKKIEMLALIIDNYQREMSELNLNIRNTQQWTQKLKEVKGKYIQMEKKCSSLQGLRNQVKKKQDKLLKLKQNLKQIKEEQKSIPSIQTMIKVLAHPGKKFNNSSRLYLTYAEQIKSLFKIGQQQLTRRESKIVKVKQTIESIREGRKKFNELINIYQARISKLQDKIRKAQGYNQK